MDSSTEVVKLAAYCRAALPLATAELGREFGYPSVALCVIDSVWSIGVRYEAVTNVVQRYCQYVGCSDATCNQSLTGLLADIAGRGTQFYADEVFKNHQLTSTRGGILKAEAVYRYAKVLLSHGIDELSHVQQILPDPQVEKELGWIPGHSSGISYKYLLMLTGSYNQIKPDRMILRFLESALGRHTTTRDAEVLLMSVARTLRPEFPQLDARLLDNLIWKYQRSR